MASSILGHSTIKLTADLYGHPIEDYELEAVRKLDGVQRQEGGAAGELEPAGVSGLVPGRTGQGGEGELTGLPEVLVPPTCKCTGT